jgi:hypothetical protein
MDRATQHIVRLRAGGLCEYCRLPESPSAVSFVLDHIIARQHRGSSTPDNLALACPDCNRQKGPNLATLDPPGTGELTVLFNPRNDEWSDHFEWDGAMLRGKTAKGRGTVFLLDINSPLRVDMRQSLMDEGTFPRDPRKL